MQRIFIRQAADSQVLLTLCIRHADHAGCLPAQLLMLIGMPPGHFSRSREARPIPCDSGKAAGPWQDRAVCLQEALTVETQLEFGGSQGTHRFAEGF